MRHVLYRDAPLADGRSSRVRLGIRVLMTGGRISRIRPVGDEGELPAAGPAQRERGHTCITAPGLLLAGRPSGSAR